MRNRLLAATAAMAITTASVGTAHAQSFGDIVGVLRTVIAVGQVLGGLSFNNVEDATNDKTCQPVADAEGMVRGQVYSDGSRVTSAGDEYVCSNVRLKGFGKAEAPQVASQMASAMDQDGETSGTIVTRDRRGREKRYNYSASATYRKNIDMDVVTIDGIYMPDERTVIEVQDKRFYAVDVRTRLNLRSGPGTNFDVTGKFARNNIVEVIGVVPALDNRARCGSGRWALLASSGAGVGYICTDYLKDAPTGTTPSQVSLAMRPDRAFRPPTIAIIFHQLARPEIRSLAPFLEKSNSVCLST